jgi:hypothetical protein
MKNKKDDINGRRDFLKKMALTVGGVGLGTPLEMMVRSAIYGNTIDAIANENGINPRRYLYIQQNRAPSRWFFDLPLALDDADWSKMQRNNSGLVTRFVGSSSLYNEAIYETWRDPQSGLRLPWLWQFRVAGVGGGTRPMTELLESMMSIRGVNVANIAHNSASMLHFHPAGLSQSITSFAADHGGFPIPCINVGSIAHSFSSNKGLSHVDLPRSGVNHIEALMKPLQNVSNLYTNQKNSVKSIVQVARDIFDQLAIDRHVGHQNGKAAKESAEEMISSGLAGTGPAEYTALVAKYNDLISRTVAGTYLGINDRPVRGTPEQMRSSGTPQTLTDFRTTIRSTTTVDNLASHFASAEYILTKNISNSVVISPGTLSSLGLQGRSTFALDSHDDGSFSCTMFLTFYYLSYGACLIELIDSLKSAGIYNDTVIDLCGEFGRNPRNDDGGSDHSDMANNNTFFSGAISGPHFIGNIRTVQASGNSRYTGTYGYQANNPGVGLLSIRHFTSTLATMLRTPNPFSTPSLIEEKNGVITPLLPRGKIVDN